MAKGEGLGLYVPVAIDSEDPHEISAWAFRELMRISAVMEIALARNVEFYNHPPAKPREGMIVGADGTNWNPGSGKGIYAYYSGAWNYLG